MPLHPDDGNLAALAAHERATDPTRFETRVAELLGDELDELIAGLDRETLNEALWCAALPRSHRDHDAGAIHRMVEDAAHDKASRELEAADIERDIDQRPFAWEADEVAA